MFKSNQQIDEKLQALYLTEDANLRARRNKILCTLGMILMPVGALIDHLFYPMLMWDFLIIRIAVVLSLMVIYLLHNTDFGKRKVVSLSILGPLILNLSFAAMILFSDGAYSRYHTLLSLMILGGGILLPWTLAETVFLSVITIIMYFTACMLHGLFVEPMSEYNTMLNNSYFILIGGIIASTSSYFNTVARVNDFVLRQELDDRNKKLEEMDRLKSRFFANISHELRTPLTLILAPIQDLLQSSTDFDEKIYRLLNTAHNNALRLLRLVNELLEVIKLEEGKMDYDGEAIDVNDFLAAMIDSMRHLAESNQITLSKKLYPGPHFIIADSYMLERIFINLIGNAIKFTPAGGSIIVSEEILNNAVVIKVADTGIGISEADLPYIFDRFHQAGNSSTHRSQGTGLGLALVKELIEIMHGGISVTSKLGSGTTMQITFPLSEQEALTNADSTQEYSEEINKNIHAISSKEAGLINKPAKPVVSITQPPAGEEPLILVVDDEPDMRNYLVTSLEKNYRVMQAQDGEQALNSARKYKPDFILLDLMLPKIDGLQVCRTLKQDIETKHIKIMLLTARIDEEAKINALKNGADDFLTKPFSKVEVQTRLRNLLQTANLETTLRIHNKELQETLSELKQTQAQLIHSEKINALGKLTAGLLHEINNPLNYALTALQMVQREPLFKEDEVLQETFQDMDEGMNRIKTIICELQVFAHPSEANKHDTFSIQDAVTSALRFTSNELGAIRVINNIQDNEVIGSRGSIVQILINLLSNASKAIAAVPAQEGRKGEISITTELKDNRLYIRVRDNGIGINEETIQNIFDPFFTSRDVGEGMGLGLSICHTIVKNHGGQLTVISEYGQWTEFCFDLPIAAEINDSNELKLHAVK